MPILKIIKAHFFEILLFLVLSFLCSKNFTPGTFLIGWDNLMPELNIWMNLKRSLSAVWQEYQGLGLVGGMGHATDLVRQIILLPLILVLPNNLIRYLWHFGMMFLGTFGIYFGLKNQLKFKKSISFFSALFYLLNFGSVQYFWAPLESFSTFWGFFPWLIFTLWQVLDKPTKSNYFKLLTLNFLAIPSFYVQTIFIVYLFCIFFTFLAFLVTHKSNFINQFKIFLLIILINSFWLLPFAYFLKTNLTNPTSGIGNLMSSDETFDRNLARGNLSDFLILRGYYFDYPGNEGQLMAPWVQYYNNFYHLLPGYILSLLVLIGLISLLSSKNRRSPISLSLLFIFFLSALALLTNVPLIKEINFLIRQSSLLNQVFRSPFTKFAVPAIFSFSLLLAYGLNTLGSLLKKIRYSKNIFICLQFIFLLLLLYFSYPSFQGYYIYPTLRQKIPQDYFKTFDYFKTQSKTSRIMNLPQGSFWGWTNYRFNVTGSGFLWYGIEQPILDRAFDAWNLKNEQYYWELTTAIQKQNPTLLKNILSKYSIEYILFDNNIYFPDEKIYSHLSRPTLELLNQIDGLQLVQQFNHIYIFKFEEPTKPYLIQNPVSINQFNFSYSDPVYNLYGDYIASSSPSTQFPYVDLFTNRTQKELTFTVTENPTSLTLTHLLNHQSTTFPKDNFVNTNVSNSPVLNGQKIINNKEAYFTFKNQHNSNVFVYNFAHASLSDSYLVKVEYRHLHGMPLRLSIVSQNTRHKYLDTYLDRSSDWSTAWFVIPKSESGDFSPGINLIFNNASYSQQSTQNDIKSVSLYPFPYDALVQIQNGLKPPQSPTRQYLESTSHIFFYKVKLSPTTSNTYLVLPQSFSSGWQAFYLKNSLPHLLPSKVLINNWSNGWQLPSDINTQTSTIYLIFWPQILEFLGLGFLILLILLSKSYRLLA